MVAWAFHRISGIGIFAFVVLHVIDIYLVGGNPELYDEVLAFYASLPGRSLEVVLGRGAAVPRAQRAAHHHHRPLAAR